MRRSATSDAKPTITLFSHVETYLDSRPRSIGIIRCRRLMGEADEHVAPDSLTPPLGLGANPQADGMPTGVFQGSIPRAPVVVVGVGAGQTPTTTTKTQKINSAHRLAPSP